MANYQKIIDLVVEHGHQIKADHIIKASPKVVQARSAQDDERYYQKLTDGMRRCDGVFIEATHPSLSVGYFLAQAASLNKPVVVFYSGPEEPHLLKTLEVTNDKLAVVRYTDLIELKREVPLMLDFVTEVQDLRFNFFISPSLANYLEKVSRQKRMPRSVYLRRLIDQDMAQNDNYQG